MVKRESEAIQARDAERDIAVALTFLRWRQKNGHQVSATLDYDEVEY